MGIEQNLVTLSDRDPGTQFTSGIWIPLQTCTTWTTLTCISQDMLFLKGTSTEVFLATHIQYSVLKYLLMTTLGKWSKVTCHDQDLMNFNGSPYDIKNIMLRAMWIHFELV